jgi:capsular polysaccharide biosynthesis protein
LKSSSVYKALLNIANKAIQRFVNEQQNRSGSTTLLLAETPPFAPALPMNRKQLPAALAAYFHEEIRLPQVLLHRLSRMMVSWHMVVFRNLRIFLPALAHPREEKHYDSTYLLQQWTGKGVLAPTDGRGLLLVHNQWTGSNYYHWMIDSLPRLLLVQTLCPGCRVLMPAPVADFVRTSAALLGFTDLVLLQKGETLREADLIIPEHTTPPGYQHPAVLRELRKQLVGAVYKDARMPKPYRKVYISRRSQRVRRLVNEDEIMALLKHHAYEVWEFEGMSLVEQVKLMSETKTLMSLHGAGLTNMLFLPAGAQVAELLNADKIIKLSNQNFENLIYFRMASALELPYYCLPCENVEDGTPTNEAHLRVEIKSLQELLEIMDSDRMN